MVLILHVCCGDCLLRYLIALGYPLPVSAQAFVTNYQKSPPPKILPQKIILYFTNPNLYPQSEYTARLQAVQKIATALNFPLHVNDYQPQTYFALSPMQNQLQTLRPHSKRCAACQNLRLTQTFIHFKKLTSTLPNSSHYQFSTTMLASSYLDHQQITTLAKNLSADKFFAPTFLTNPAVIKTTGFFQQNYCGCLFSLLQKSQDKFLASQNTILSPPLS